MLKQKRYHSGQSLIMAMAIVLAASVMLFFVFNSGRAVNHKINLVNAADAAAYSGAQITARQLNFMAYTNRAMIANEVSVGHMFSYQMEMDVVKDMFQNLVENGGGFAFDFLVWIISIFVPGFSEVVDSTFATFGQVLDGMEELTQGVTGLYALVIDSNNAFYSSLQQQAFRDFAYPEDGQRPLVEAAMSAVLTDYQANPSMPIQLNDPATLAYFADTGTGAVQEMAIQAADMRSALCRMMLFVRPSGGAMGSTTGAGNQMQAFCDSLTAGGGGNMGGDGTPNSPMADNGAMVDMLRTTYSTMENAEWIRNRDLNYRWFLATRVERRGTTSMEYDAAAGQLNWEASDSIRVGDPLLNIRLAGGAASGNVGDLSQEAGASIGQGLVTMFETWGLCGAGATVSCADLAGGRYSGVQQYAYLNPDFDNGNQELRPRITAFVSQSACGDGIGVDEEGTPVEGWHNNLRSFDDGGKCAEVVYAAAQAEVFFQRPACVNPNAEGCEYGFRELRNSAGAQMSEKPNLFNPFWQVRIIR